MRLSDNSSGCRKKTEFTFPFHFFDLFINELPQDIRVVPYDALLNALISIDHNIRETLAAGNTIVRDRRIDLSAVRALTGFQPRRIAVIICDADAVRLEHRGVYVLPGEMGVGPEHVGADVAPHHELDHALGHTFLDEMRDPAVPEDMGCDVFLYAGCLRDTLEPLVDGCMDERLAAFVYEDQPLPARVRLVARSPLRQVFPGHDEPDVPGHVGLEIHVRDDTVFVERKISPGHGPDLADTEPAFVEAHDDRPVNGPGACLHHCGDLIGSQQVCGHLGHGVLRRGPEFVDFTFGEWGIFVVYHPEVKLFENSDEVTDGVLFEWRLTAALCSSQLRDCSVQITDGIVCKRTDEPAPGNEREGEFVCPTGADVLAGPEFCNEFPDLGGINRRDGEILKGGLDGVFCQIGPDVVKRAFSN